MSEFAALPKDVKINVRRQIKNTFGPYAEVNERDEIQIMYPNPAYQPIHGYVAIRVAKYLNEVLVCDSTPDEGDRLVATFRW